MRSAYGRIPVIDLFAGLGELGDGSVIHWRVGSGGRQLPG